MTAPTRGRLTSLLSRSPHRSALFCAITLLLVCSAACQAAPLYRVTGTLTSSRDGSVIRHSSFTATQLAENGEMAPLPAVPGDDAGHFAILLPAAGSWRIEASAPGYRRQAYDEHAGFSSAIVLSAATPSLDLAFHLLPDSTLSGHVLDEAGEPVRSAHLTLFELSSVDLSPHPRSQPRGAAQTDDRGYYEFPGLPPGDFRISLQAEPWYATATGGASGGPRTDGAPSSPLDVVYPMTWFPGTRDPETADTLTLHGGDTRQADFRLLPVPSVHIRIPGAGRSDPGGQPIATAIPQISLVTAAGTSYVPMTLQMYENGDFDVGGLSTGTYQVLLPTPGQGNDSVLTTLHIKAGSSSTIDLKSATAMIKVTFAADGIPVTDIRSVRLEDKDTGVSVFGSLQVAPRPPHRFSAAAAEQPAPTLTLEASPGRYEVFAMTERNGSYLTGITATGAEAHGRTVTLRAGHPVITLHLAKGRASLAGIVTRASKPLAGAVVLLVPASQGSPDSVTFLRRDQSNTDGSYDVPDLVPGPYILVAIDHGWAINFADPGTLARYLLHGTALDIKPGAPLRQNLDAQAP